MSEIPRRIRTARVFAGLTQPELAAKLDLGESTYKNSELGKRETPWRERVAIAAACGVPPWFIEHGWDGCLAAQGGGEGETGPRGHRPRDLIPPDEGGDEDAAETL